LIDIVGYVLTQPLRQSKVALRHITDRLEVIIKVFVVVAAAAAAASDATAAAAPAAAAVVLYDYCH
jgi:hypothetical protein